MEGISLLNISEIKENIENMFKEEEKRLIIISPFINKEKNSELVNLLIDSKAEILLFYKLPEDGFSYEQKKYDETCINDFKKEFKDKDKNIKYFELKYLHAKAYISSKESIVTSFNLNANDDNFELGIKFDNKIYTKLYEKIIFDLNKLLKINNNNYIIHRLKT
jgi:phosphatidylserine/phosphatidylglycerophosphate/cardiolipin synthase-like enzyme